MQIGLATIGVCVFCAVASVAALFIFWRNENEKDFITDYQRVNGLLFGCL